jgi:DNA-directed RNA polymerase delta subunit
VKKTTEYFPAWKMDAIRDKAIDDVSKVVIKFLNTQDDVLPENELCRVVQKNLTRKESLRFVKSCLEIDRQLKRTEEGWGLMSWRHINPKSIRDKAYIVLKQHSKPLHFVEITNKITEAQFDHKVVTVQAVHNELIRDEKFVLVGRGLYALKEWGYVEGTVSDVIERILMKSKKPMTKAEIVKRVLEVRDVKIGTIALNLQKNPHFIRVGRAVYALKGGKKK